MQVDGVIDCEVLSNPTDPWFEWEGGRGVNNGDWLDHPELLVGELLRFSFGGFVVRGGPLLDRIVLVDAGNGPDGDEFIPPGALLESLLALGVGPDEISDVLLTHLHYDHTGWLSVDGKPTFANATVHVAQAEIDYFTAPGTPGLSANFAAERLRIVENHLSAFSGECVPVPGINAVPAPGHTPGSTVFVASSPGQRVIFLGDVVHCPVQLLEPEWAVLGDVDPVLAAKTRTSLERELDGASLAGAHFPGLTLGRLIRSAAGKHYVVG